MRINYIELRNYRKFERIRLELPDGIIGIIGENGVGKSTLVESIAWALFGNQKDIVRESKESIRRAGAPAKETTSVKIEFTYANDEYIVTREMSGKSLSIDASLTINGKAIAHGADEVTKEIEKKLGMDYKSFFISVFARQKDLAALSTLPTNQRRAMIVRMLGIDRLDDIIKEISTQDRIQRNQTDNMRSLMTDENGRPKGDSLKNDKERLSKERDGMEREMSSLKKSQESSKVDEVNLRQRSAEISAKLRTLVEIENKLKIENTKLEAKGRELDQAKKGIEEAHLAESSAKELDSIKPMIQKIRNDRDRLLEAKKDQERLLESRNELDRMTAELSEIDKQLKDLTNEKKELDENLLKSAQIKEQKETIEGETEAIRQRNAELKETVKTFKKEIQKNQKHLDDISKLGPDSTCPTCERTLGDHYQDLLSRLKSSVEGDTQNITELQDGMKKSDEEISERNKRLDAINKKIEILNRKERELAKAEQGIELKKKEKEKLERQLAKIKKEIHRLDEVKFDELALRTMIEQLEKLEKEKEKLTEAAAIAKKLPEFKKTAENIASEISKIEEIISKIKFDPLEKELLETSYDEIEKKRILSREQTENIVERLMELTRKNEAVVTELNAVNREISSLSGTLDRLNGLEEELSYITRLQEIMKGFRENLVNRIVPTLSQIASELLSQLTDGRYDSLILDNEYNISIEDAGKKHGIDRFSGGETDLANLCLRLAISKVIAERTYSEGINLLVLDEIFGSQDASRKRNLLSSFNGLSRQFRQIILITHVDDIRDQLGTIIDVYQDENGISHAKLLA